MKITLDIPQPDLEKLIAPAMIRRLLYIYADALDIDLFSCGSATCKSQSTNRGLEPDESFCIGDRKSFPDLAIEVTVTSGGIDKLQIYQGLQIPEVWFYQRDRFSLYRIKQDGTGYTEITQSQIFPNLDLNLMAQYINPEHEPEMVRAWRKLIQSNK
jgi:Uma2 family endonuclease